MVLLIVVLLLAALAAGPGLLSDGYLREQLESSLRDALGVHVTVASLSVSWWSDAECGEVRIHESTDPDSPVLVNADGVLLDRALLALLAGDSAVRVTVIAPKVVLRAVDGELVVWPVLERCAGAVRASARLEPNRGLDVVFEQATLQLGDDRRAWRLDVGASCDHLGDDPLRFQVVLDGEGERGGKIEIGGALDNWSEAGAPIGFSGVLRADGLDLAPLAPLLGPWLDVQPLGIVRRARFVVAGPPEGARKFSLDLDVDGLVLASRGQAVGDALTFEARARGRFDAEGISSLEASLDLPDGGARLTAPGSLQWTDGAVSGDLAFDATFDDAARVTTALDGVLPAEARLFGRVKIAGRVHGRLPTSAGLDLVERVAELGGALDVELDRARVGETRLEEVRVVTTAEKGRLRVTTGRAQVGGGELVVQGEIAYAPGAGDSRLTFRADQRVTIVRELADGELLVSASGSGSVEVTEGESRVVADGLVSRFVWPRAGAPSVSLADLKTHLDIRLSPSGQVRGIDHLSVIGPELELVVRDGVVTHAPGRSEATGTVVIGVGAHLARVLGPPLWADLLVEDRVRFEGRLGWPLDGASHRVRAAGTVSGAGVWVGGRRLETFSGRATLNDDTLRIDDLDATLGGGRITGVLDVHLDGLASGDSVRLGLAGVPFEERLETDDGRSLVIAGKASGSVRVDATPDRRRLSTELTVLYLKLREDGVVRATSSVVKINGAATVTADGILDVKDASVTGEGISATVIALRWPLAVSRSIGVVRAGSGPATVDGRFILAAPWAHGLLGSWWPDAFSLEDDLAVSARGSIAVGANAGQTRLKLYADATRARMRTRTWRDVRCYVTIDDGRISCDTVGAKVDEGEVVVGGTVALVASRRRVGDRLRVTMRGLPIDLEETLPRTGKVFPMLKTSFIADGAVEITADRARRLRVSLRGRATRAVRRLIARGPIVSRVLPDLAVEADAKIEADDLFGVPPRFTVSAAVATGKGLRIAVADARRDRDHVELGRLEVAADRSSAEALSLGRLGHSMTTVRSDVRVWGQGSLRAGPASWRGGGTWRVDLATIMGVLVRQVSMSARMRDGRVSFAGTGRQVGGENLQGRGEVRLGDETWIDLARPERPFRFQLEARRVPLDTGQRPRLAGLHPVFAAPIDTGNPLLEGRFDADLDLRGVMSGIGWRRSLSGVAKLKLSSVRIGASTLLDRLGAAVVDELGEELHDELVSRLGQAGAPGGRLVDLVHTGFAITDGTWSFVLDEGRMVSRTVPFVVSGPDLALRTDGDAGFDGSGRWTVRTDLLGRVRAQLDPIADSALLDRLGKRELEAVVIRDGRTGLLRVKASVKK
ncbi:MAG: hypothetical protein CMJ83_08425 [Planctomycetes bacterium]|nr:hypothetical protein [Planctomycetota bacterium]